MTSMNNAPGVSGGRAPARRKALLVVIIAAAIVLLAAVVLMALSPTGSRIDFWFVFPGVCALAGCYLAFGLLGALARGKVADALRTGIQVLTVALLFGLLAIFFPNAPKGTLGFGLMLIIAGSAAVGAYLAKAYSEHYWLIGRAAVLVVLGISLELGGELTTFYDILRGLPLMIGLTMALLSLLGILHEHSNPMARMIGRFFRNGPNLITIMIVLTLVFVYALKLRDIIAQKAPDQTVLAEWIVVAIVIIVVGYKFYSHFRSLEKPQDFCDTRRLVQSIYQDKGDTSYAQSVVDRFIAEGKREPLVVLITTVLVKGGTDPYEIENIIGGVVRYTTAERRFAFRWALGDEAAMKKEERTRIAFDALDQTARALEAAYLMSDRARSAGIAEG